MHYHQARRVAPSNPCECGCGGLALRRFVTGHSTRLLTPAEQARRAHHNDGSALRDRGEGKTYRKVAQRHEHRAVAEQKIGRALLPGEIVHHRDENKRNNHPDNLEVMTQAEHARLHMLERHASRL